MPLSTKLAVSLAAKQTASLDLGAALASLSLDHSLSLSDGAAAGQANRAWSDTRTIAASGTDDVDLAGALLDGLGGGVVLARVKLLVVRAAAANTNNVVVGAAASNAWATLLGATHTVTLRPGALLVAAAGQADLTAYVVTAGTGDLLRIANSGGGSSVSYDIAVIGAAS